MPSSPILSTIGALFPGRGFAKLEVFRVAHVGDQFLRLFAYFLISSVLCKSCRKDSWLGWFSNCWINFLTVSLRFVSCCWTAEWGVPGIHKSTLPLRVSPQHLSDALWWSDDFLASWPGWSCRPLCELGFSVIRSTLGDRCTLRYSSSWVLMHTALSIQIEGSVLWRTIACDRVWQNCNPLLWASFKLHQYTVLMRYPSIFVWSDPWLVQAGIDRRPSGSL